MFFIHCSFPSPRMGAFDTGIVGVLADADISLYCNLFLKKNQQEIPICGVLEAARRKANCPWIR